MASEQNTSKQPSTFERVLNLVIEARYPNLQYWFECEFEERSEEFWEEIEDKLLEEKVVKVTRKYFAPKFPNKRRVYRAVKTSFCKLHLHWWETESKRYTEEQFGEIYSNIEKGGFRNFLENNYSDRVIPEPHKNQFIRELNYADHKESDEEDSGTETTEGEDLDEDEDSTLQIKVSSENQTTETTENSESENPESQDNEILERTTQKNQTPLNHTFSTTIQPPPRSFQTSHNNILQNPHNTVSDWDTNWDTNWNTSFIPPLPNYQSNTISIGSQTIVPPYLPPPTSTPFSGFSTPPRQIISPEYDADNSGDSPEQKEVSKANTKTVQFTENLKTVIPTKSNMSSSTSSASKKGKGHVTFQNRVHSDGKVWIQVRGLKDEDKQFTLHGMPFYQRQDDTDKWTTPHNSDFQFTQSGDGFDIPMDIFISSKYRSADFKEIQDKRFNELQEQFRTFETTEVAKWTAAQQAIFTEYSKIKQERMNQQLEEMRLNQETGQTLIQRHHKPKGWLDWLGDPFREQIEQSADPNEKLVYGDIEEAQMLTPGKMGTTGDPDDEKFMKFMSTLINQLTPQEYRVSNYPMFDGSQDPYEWLIKYENACAINRVRNGRKLEILNGCLEGTAQAWWRNIRPKVKRFGGLTDPTLDPKESFKYWFLTRFCGPDRQYQWTRELRNLKQMDGETVDSYATKLTNLYFRADPRKAYPEYDLLNQFIEGLRRDIRIETRKANPSTVNKAIEIAKNAELAFSDGGPTAAYSLIKQADIKNDLEQIKVLLTKPETTESCNLCYGGKHKTEDCPQRSIKRVNLATPNNNRNQLDKNACFACGKTGHIKRNCPEVCQNCGIVGHKAPECRKRNNNNNYQPKVLQRNKNGPWNQNNRNTQNNRSSNYNNNNNYNNRQNQNQNNQQKKVFVAETQHEELASQMAELTNAIKNLKA